jgi:hypothetical protein
MKYHSSTVSQTVFQRRIFALIEILYSTLSNRKTSCHVHVNIIYTKLLYYTFNRKEFNNISLTCRNKNAAYN